MTANEEQALSDGLHNIAETIGMHAVQANEQFEMMSNAIYRQLRRIADSLETISRAHETEETDHQPQPETTGQPGFNRRSGW